MRKLLLWILFGGMVYYAIEGIWRIPDGGWANAAMIAVGGICFALVGGINQIPAFFNLSMRAQALIGAVIVLSVEYISGVILNVRLGFAIWDYSSLPFNLHGQICIPFAGLWFLLMPFAIWLEDRANIVLYAYQSFRANQCRRAEENDGLTGEYLKDGQEIEATYDYTEIPKWDYTLRNAYRELVFGES